ncbi:PorP/SprF family type IX secretion system membrane protein [Ascidiimonas sp. W6]|uniref:PorP/SprF family type IX secretion system membrane protein n=1 Tax=Ascidiimonas meishanensis TaxID=3128903 RepID=UPI0030EF139F
MIRNILSLFIFFGSLSLLGQESNTPRDLRQHNLGNFNSNILNPAFSYARNENPTALFWGRSQWTDLEFSPETYFINYSQRINDYSAAGLGGFLHDTGIYETGGFIGNYAYSFDVGRESQITIGLNIIGSIRKLQKFFFTREEYEALPKEQRENFTLAAMPGIVFTSGNLTLGVVSENLVDYNLTNSEAVSDDKIFTGHAGYQFDFDSSSTLFEGGSLKTLAYIKNIPNFETQYGGSILLDISHGWMQAGYNNFYGPAIGLGAKINKLRIGGIIELPNAESDENLGTTFEVFLAWNFGDPKENNKGFAGPVKKKKPKKKVIIQKEVTVTEDALSENNKKSDSLSSTITKIDDHYSTVEKIEGVAPGFYLIVNVYSTQKYFESFMAKLKKQGLTPKYFVNEANNYYYVYLEKYDTFKAASAARISNYNGKYKGSSWIFNIQK